ncbi:MAG: hypothetical protein ACPGR8_17335, partial [Limisphaerales bacterium]
MPPPPRAGRAAAIDATRPCAQDRLRWIAKSLSSFSTEKPSEEDVRRSVVEARMATGRKGLGKHAHSLLLRMWYWGRNYFVEWSGSTTKLAAVSGNIQAAPYHILAGPTDDEQSVYVCQHLLNVLTALREHRFEITLFPLFDVDDALKTAYKTGALPDSAPPIKLWHAANSWIVNRGPPGSPVWIKGGERCVWATLSSLVSSGVRRVCMAGRTANAIRLGHVGATWIDLVTGGTIGQGVRVNGVCLEKKHFETS